MASRDGGAHTKFLTAGRFPTEGIVKYCRENQWLSLKQIHWRLSALPAFCGGFKDRGFLREGAPADIVVYDFDKLNVMPIEILHDLPGNEWRRVQRATATWTDRQRPGHLRGRQVHWRDFRPGASPRRWQLRLNSNR